MTSTERADVVLADAIEAEAWAVRGPTRQPVPPEHAALRVPAGVRPGQLRACDGSLDRDAAQSHHSRFRAVGYQCGPLQEVQSKRLDSPPPQRAAAAGSASLPMTCPPKTRPLPMQPLRFTWRSHEGQEVLGGADHRGVAGG